MKTQTCYRCRLPIALLIFCCSSINSFTIAQNTFPQPARVGVYTTTLVTSLQVKGGAASALLQIM